MIVGRSKSGRARCAAFALAVVLAASGCSASLLDRAIRARGGALTSVERESDATVYLEFPGEWSWAIAYRTPDLFRWTLHAFGEDQSYVYDGSSVTLFLGSAALPADPAAALSFRSQARFVGVSMLDAVVHAPEARIAELPASELPSGASHGLRVRFPGDGTSYDLLFDASDLLVAMSGPVSMPPVGAGTLRAEYGDFRVVDGFKLPFRIRYVLNGQVLAEERVKQLVPNPPALTAASFGGAG